jgi:hypothetical protein
MLSCSRTADNVAPKSQKSLGLVIPRPASELSSNLILLKDGRIANPVSGIPSFDTIAVGNRLFLSFTAGSMHDGVLNIQVTKFASAQDSAFNPTPPSTDTTTFTGVFLGVAYAYSSDSSFHQTGNTSIHFTSSNKYNCAGVEGGYPLPGSGTFIASNGTITFTDSNSISNSVLSGSFGYGLNSGGLYMWTKREEIYYGYSLKRD